MIKKYLELEYFKYYLMIMMSGKIISHESQSSRGLRQQSSVEESTLKFELFSTYNLAPTVCVELFSTYKF